jgi:hypothetical protein
MEKYYLYRHIRLDKNEPFYIGIGTINKKSNTIKSRYSRAYDKVGRNNIWKGITKRTEYEIEILLESNDRNFIIEREIEFISLYGRICNHTGSLTNLSEGGEGAYGIKGKLNAMSQELFQYDFEGNFIKTWENAEEVHRQLGWSPSMIHRNCNGFLGSAHNHRWFKEYKGEKVDSYNPKEFFSKFIYKYDLEFNLLGKYLGSTEAANSEGLKDFHVRCACNAKLPVNGLIWSYIELTKEDLKLPKNISIIRAINKITGEVLEERAKNVKNMVEKVNISEATIYRIMRNATSIKSDWNFEKIHSKQSPAKRIESTLALEKIFV